MKNVLSQTGVRNDTCTLLCLTQHNDVLNRVLRVTMGWPAVDHRFRIEPTPCFSVLCTGSSGGSKATARKSGRPLSQHGARSGVSEISKRVGVVCIDVVCPYTRSLVEEGLSRRSSSWRVTTNSADATLHWGDYEMIDWERVVSGQLRASSYCVRKGLSRKAQLSRYCNKYASKRPGTPLKAALPRTLVIDTWEAFDDDMTFNLGGDIAAFGADMGVRQSVSLATRLDWCLGEAEEWLEQDHRVASDENVNVSQNVDGHAEECPGEDRTSMEGQRSGAQDGEPIHSGPADESNRSSVKARRRKTRRRWILKPSTLNKGAGLTLGEGFEPLRSAIHESPDIREWVLQEYVEKPLLAGGRKFHLRAYALAVGCIQVYLFDKVLLLRAAKQYPVRPSSNSTDAAGNGGGNDKEDDRSPLGEEDPLAHITNTARQAEDEAFREEDNVWLLEDLVDELVQHGRTPEDARSKVDGVMSDMRTLTAELFMAFRGEFMVFSPLPGCFEHFGLDFMVDEDFHVWLLEANPGPDFKQTGSRLKHVIAELIEGTMCLCIDEAGSKGPPATAEAGMTDRDGCSRTIEADNDRDLAGFSMVLDEPWRGTGAGPSMKML